MILSITVTACAGVKSTNVICPHNGTYDLCIFVIFSETSFVDVCAANHRFPQITFEALRTGCPPYLTDFLQHHQPTRSSHLSLLLFRNITYRLDPGLSALQPHVSGTPCLSILANPSRSLPAFKRHLNTHFCVANNSSSKLSHFHLKDNLVT